MKIPKKVWEAWKLKREHGDVEKIHEQTKRVNKKISAKTIGNALNSGRCDRETFIAIATYYKNAPVEDEKLIKEALG